MFYRSFWKKTFLSQQPAFSWVMEVKPNVSSKPLQQPSGGKQLQARSKNLTRGSNPPLIRIIKSKTPQGISALNLLASLFAQSWFAKAMVSLSQPKQELGTTSYLFSHFLIQHGNWIGPDGCRWRDWQAHISSCLYLVESPGAVS